MLFNYSTLGAKRKTEGKGKESRLSAFVSTRTFFESHLILLGRSEPSRHCLLKR
jgi:hypothetical protein